MLRSRPLGVALAGLFAMALAAKAQQLPAPPQTVDFTRDIAPLLHDRFRRGALLRSRYRDDPIMA